MEVIHKNKYKYDIRPTILHDPAYTGEGAPFIFTGIDDYQDGDVVGIMIQVRNVSGEVANVDVNIGMRNSLIEFAGYLEGRVWKLSFGELNKKKTKVWVVSERHAFITIMMTAIKDQMVKFRSGKVDQCDMACISKRKTERNLNWVSKPSAGNRGVSFPAVKLFEEKAKIPLGRTMLPEILMFLCSAHGSKDNLVIHTRFLNRAGVMEVPVNAIIDEKMNGSQQDVMQFATLSNGVICHRPPGIGKIVVAVHRLPTSR